MANSNTVLDSSSRAEASVLLLDLWEDLDALQAFALGRKRAEGLRAVPSWVYSMHQLVDGDSPQDTLRRWLAVFADELAVVRAARNTVAHSLLISDDDLAAAVRTASRLLLMARMIGEPQGTEVHFPDARIAKGLRFAEPATERSESS